MKILKITAIVLAGLCVLGLLIGLISVVRPLLPGTFDKANDAVESPGAGTIIARDVTASDLELSAKTMYVDYMVAGTAGVRVEENSDGLKFQTLIVKDFYDGLIRKYGETNVFAGTCVVPVDSLASVNELSVQGLDSAGVNYSIIASDEGFRNSNGYYLISAALVNIKAKNYGRGFLGIGFVKVMVNEEEYYFYPVSFGDSSLFTPGFAYKEWEDGDDRWGHKAYFGIDCNYYDSVVSLYGQENVEFRAAAFELDQVCELLSQRKNITIHELVEENGAQLHGEVLSYTGLEVAGKYYFTGNNYDATSISSKLFYVGVLICYNQQTNPQEAVFIYGFDSQNNPIMDVYQFGAGGVLNYVR